jgi:hypothetical protein
MPLSGRLLRRTSKSPLFGVASPQRGRRLPWSDTRCQTTIARQNEAKRLYEQIGNMSTAWSSRNAHPAQRGTTSPPQRCDGLACSVEQVRLRTRDSRSKYLCTAPLPLQWAGSGGRRRAAVAWEVRWRLGVAAQREEDHDDDTDYGEDVVHGHLCFGEPLSVVLSATRAPRRPRGLGQPAVVSTWVCDSSSALSSAPYRLHRPTGRTTSAARPRRPAARRFCRSCRNVPHTPRRPARPRPTAMSPGSPRASASAISPAAGRDPSDREW